MRPALCLLLLCILAACGDVAPTATPAPTPTPAATATPAPPTAPPTPTAPALNALFPMKIQAKTFHAANYSVTGDQNEIQFSIDITNATGKDVKAFTGAIHFRDVFDRDIMPANFTNSDGIPAGKTLNWKGAIRFNPYIDTNVALRDAKLEDTSVVFIPDQVIYADGTKQQFP